MNDIPRTGLIITVLIVALIRSSISSQVAVTDYTYVDKWAQNVPRKESKSIEQLTDYLTSPFENDLFKVRAIYTWIGNNIRYDYRELKPGDLSYNHDVNYVFSKRKAVCTGYANLFAHMNFLAGITSIPVSGYSKNRSTSTIRPGTPDHVWNAIKLNDKWHLVDVTWDAALSKGSVLSNNYFNLYFLSDPLVFLQDHFPSIPMWQLSKSTFELDDFINDNIPLNDSLLAHQNFNYEILIDDFLKLEKPLQRVYEYRQTFNYNPTEENAKAMAHGLLDYAAILTDSLDKWQAAAVHHDEILPKTEMVVNLCKESAEYTSFHDWQSRMFANALMSLVVLKYNSAIPESLNKDQFYHELLGYLSKSMNILQAIKDDQWTRGSITACQQLLDVLNKKLSPDK